MSDYKIKEQRKMYGWKKGMNDGQTHRRLEGDKAQNLGWKAL